MAGIVIDELITKLEYQSNDQVIKQAEQAVRQLGEQNKATAETADALSADQRKLAEQTDRLSRAQLDLANQMAESSSKTEQLKSEQRELRAAVEQAGGATGKQFRRLEELDAEIQQSTTHTRELREESSRLGRVKQEIAAESRKVSRAQSDVAKTSRQAADGQRRLKDAMRQATEKARDEAGVLGQLSERIKGVAGGDLAADAVRAVAGGIVDLGRNVIETGANFESLRARLKTVEGTSEDAANAFAMIQDFAAKTPFEVENITEAFTALRVRGVQPTTATLTALGDLSSAFGLQFKDTTDAIGAAARGELDPIEKLGIQAKIAGDKISLSFKGQAVMVDRTADAVTNALVAFGQMDGVQGAMAEQSTTTAGMFSNLKDTVSAFFDQIAQMGVLDEVKLLMESLSDSMGENGLGQIIADVLIIALQSMREMLEGMPLGPVIEFVQILVTILGQLAEVLIENAQNQAGLIGMMYEFITPLLQIASKIYEVSKRLDEMGEKMGGMPGPIDAIIGSIKLLIAGMQWWADLCIRIIDQIIVPFIEQIALWVDGFTGLAGAFDTVSAAITGLATDIGLMNAELSTTATVAKNAKDAIEALAAAEQQKKWGIKANEDNELRDAADAAFKARTAAKTARMDKLLEHPDDLSRDALDNMLADPELSEKQQKKVENEIYKREHKKPKKGGKGPADDSLSAEIRKQITSLSEESGKRAAARASLAAQQRGKPLTDEQRNKVEMDARAATHGRLTSNYQATGALPPGLAMDLVQAAALPNLEETGGRLAPPVITVNNTRIEVTGNTFEANITVEGGINGTPQAVASAVTTQAQGVTFQGLGRAIQNQLTNER